MYLQDSSQSEHSLLTPGRRQNDTQRSCPPCPVLFSLGPPVSLSPECGPQLYPPAGLCGHGPLPTCSHIRPPFRIVTQSVWGQWFWVLAPAFCRRTLSTGGEAIRGIGSPAHSTPRMPASSCCSRGAVLGQHFTKSRLHRARFSVLSVPLQRSLDSRLGCA